MGFAFQSYNLIPNVPALRNVELPMISAKVLKKLRVQKAERLLLTVGLAQKLQNAASELSAG